MSKITFSNTGDGGDPTEGIPEPTSSLLAMLGLADLALRRKQK